jgi:hypothetical protein
LRNSRRNTPRYGALWVRYCDFANGYVENIMDAITFISAYPAWIKILFSVGALCIFVAGLGMVFTTVPKASADAAGGSVSVTSNNQKGGITANKVNIGKQ